MGHLIIDLGHLNRMNHVADIQCSGYWIQKRRKILDSAL